MRIRAEIRRNPWMYPRVISAQIRADPCTDLPESTRNPTTPTILATPIFGVKGGNFSGVKKGGKRCHF
jgi:hypothetical protein